MNRFDVSIVVKGIFSKLAANCGSEAINVMFRAWVREKGIIRTSALFETSERHVRFQRVDAVDPDSSGLEDCGGKTIKGIVRPADDIFLVLKLDKNTNGAEDLFLDNLHVRLSVGENCGLSGLGGG